MMARCCPKPQGTQRRRAGQGPGPEASLGDDTTLWPAYSSLSLSHTHTHKETKSPAVYFCSYSSSSLPSEETGVGGRLAHTSIFLGRSWLDNSSPWPGLGSHVRPHPR